MVARRLPAALMLPLTLGVIGCDGEPQDVQAREPAELVFTLNGLGTINGLSTTNGLATSNGLMAPNGLMTLNGLSTTNGLGTINGLSSTVGLMTTPAGRTTVQYLVRCALPAGDFLQKQDQLGVPYTFPGQLGVAPAWKNGACDATCQQAISACMLAHVNTSGVHIPLWLVSPMTSIGWGTDPQYPNREGTFFGNIMLPNPRSKVVDAFYCNGPDFSMDTVPGRLGATQAGAPYTNPYISRRNPNGDCSPCSSMRADGPSSCKAGDVTFKTPVTVWRGQTFQAENAVLSGSLPKLACPDGVCSNGFRVGYIGPHSTVTFNNVFSSKTGPRVLIIYYANGDSCANDACARYFNISVNGGEAQNRAFGVVKGGNWNVIGSAPIMLSGFLQGKTNTITFQGDLAHSAPDLDWIEIE